MATHKLLLLPAMASAPSDGRGEAPDRLFNAQGIARFETEQGLVGGAAYDADKVSITDDCMAKARAADAVIFGAVGGPKWDSIPTTCGPKPASCDCARISAFRNLRPAVCYPALADASSLKREVVEVSDVMIVRELTGGVYFGEPKTITDLGNGRSVPSIRRSTTPTKSSASRGSRSIWRASAATS